MVKGRGKPIGKGHKGQHRRFTDFEDLQAQQEKIAKQSEWRKQRGDDDVENEEGSDEEEEDSDEETSEEEGSDAEDAKPKGVESLIEIENPNRAPKKTAPEVKAGTSTNAKPELSRREREEAEKLRRQNHVPVDQVRADLARLALIKQQRETARLKREAEIKAKEAEKQKAQAQAPR